jgi:hypothetical protein
MIRQSLNVKFFYFFTKYLCIVIQVTGETVADSQQKYMDKNSFFNNSKGQLTSKGFFQTLAVGELLNKYYAGVLIGKIVSSNNVYVRSTYYPRTVQVS